MENKKDEIEKLNPCLGNGRRKKHFFEDILKPILGGLGGVIVIGLYILGMYHSCSKHDEPDMLRYSPFSLYRGIEFFWHNDFAGVNWEERLKNDGKSCVYFINSAVDKSINPHELNKNIEIFSKDISKYPKDKLEILKTVSKIFIEYSITVLYDLRKAFKNYIYNGQTNFSYSGDILFTESKLKKYLPKEYFEQIRSTTEITYRQIKELFSKLDGLDETEKNSRLKNIENGLEYMKLGFNSVYKKIFNEELK